MMATGFCPSCGAEISFRSKLSITCVCPFCRSLIVRHDVNVEAIGIMAELPDDISPFQIGTAGVYQGVSFTIIGRMKMGWEDGGWNEWCLLLDSGVKGWLAEAHGALAVSLAVDLPEEAIPEGRLALGARLAINGKDYQVADLKNAECLGCEGELPLLAPKGHKILDIDLIASDGGFACLEYHPDQAKPDVYVGHYVEFDDLFFTNLREIPGWGQPGKKPVPVAGGDVGSVSTSHVQAFTCPNCGGTIQIRAAGISISAICQSCVALVDVANGNLRLIAKATAAIKDDLPLAMGTRGMLRGVEWEIIGYLEREAQDGEEANIWREYLLFNPWQGFRFLVEEDGQWNYVRMLRQAISDGDPSSVTYGGKNFLQSTACTAKATYVLGEFYWRVRVGETVACTNYVCPPHMLSREKSDQDIIWSHGVLVDSAVIQTAFHARSETWPPIVGSVLPQPSSLTPPEAWKLWRVMMVLLLGIQIISVMLAENRLIYNAPLPMAPGQKDATTVSEPFRIEKNRNIRIEIDAPVDNNWLEVELTLVNQDTDATFEVFKSIEYYHGYDENEFWSEGERYADGLLTRLPPGNYRLVTTTNSGTVPSGPNDFRVTLRRNVPIWSNFWIAIGALSLPVLLAICSRFMFVIWLIVLAIVGMISFSVSCF